jgi:hypothetical protein
MRIRRIYWIIALTTVLGVYCILPWAWHTSALYLAKRAVMRPVENLTPAERDNLNVLPTLAMLPHAAVTSDGLVEVNIGSCSFGVPRPALKTLDSKSIVLKYPRFQVRIREPFRLTTYDAKARMLNFRTAFDLRASAFKLHTQDIWSATDVESVKRIATLLIQKMDILDLNLAEYFEEFHRDDICGFVLPPRIGGYTVSVVQLYDQDLSIGCELWITGTSNVSIGEINEFLSEMQINHGQTSEANPSTHPSATESSEAH